MSSRTASSEIPGWYFELQANVLRQLPRPGEIDATTAQGWVENQKALKKVLADALLPKANNVIEKTYKVVFDYSQSLASMIKAGKYDWFNDHITDKHFSLEGEGQQEAELVLVHLDRDATTKEVREYMKEQGLEPAKIEHLLAFGTTYPELQRQFPIIALGSSFVDARGSRGCPCLDCGHDGRELNLDWNDDGDRWHDSCRFLAVRK